LIVVGGDFSVAFERTRRATVKHHRHPSALDSEQKHQRNHHPLESAPEPLLLNIHQLAEKLNVSRTTIETWTRSRRIPSFKMNRVLRYDLSKVVAALAAYERKAL
jgi:excisionase family DNA binding protein